MVLVGFRPWSTLGRRLQDGEKEVRILGEDIAVKAQVHFVPGLSAHADREQLLDWASHFRPPHATFLVHGEPEAIDALKAEFGRRLRFNVVVPRNTRRMICGACPHPRRRSADMNLRNFVGSRCASASWAPRGVHPFSAAC